MNSLPYTLLAGHIPQQIQQNCHIQNEYQKDSHGVKKQKQEMQHKENNIEKQKLS